MEKITLTTLDTVALSGLYYYPGKLEGAPKCAVICLHMMPAAKESWIPLAELLSVQGFGVLAIDLRGHGKSTGGPDGYKSFTDAEHGASREDVEAAIAYVKDQGFNEITIVGASIGANLALVALAEHEEIKTAVLLSPGLNYYGIETLSIVERMDLEHISNKRILFATSEDDERKSGNNAAMTQQLYLTLPDTMQKKIIVYHVAGHGTDMFGKEKPDLLQEIVDWIMGNKV